MGRTSAASQLALWVGRRGRGSARLAWDGHELLLHVSGLQVIAAQGYDRDHLTAAFGLTEGEWFGDARAAVETGQVSHAEASAVIKRALAENLREFADAANAEVSFDGELAFEPHGLTISYPHLVVELVLGPGGEELIEAFLPSPDSVLRRLPDFPRRVGALGLTDEGLAVLAKINDQRTATEIAERSPHGKEMALRLLAAAAGAGLAEATSPMAEVALAGTPAPEFLLDARPRLWPWLVGAVVLVVAVILLFGKPWAGGEPAAGSGPWSIAVDGGCQPPEVERLYRRKDQDSKNLQVVPFGRGDEQCRRLVWGRFASRETAERAIPTLPNGLVARGFAPHVVKVENGPT
jgi:hypothetical protein